MAFTGVSDGVIIAVISALGGGLLMPIVNLFREKQQTNAIDATKLREELWSEVNTLRGEVKELKDDLAQWQTRYFKLLADYNELEVRYNLLSAQVETLMAEKQ